MVEEQPSQPTSIISKKKVTLLCCLSFVAGVSAMLAVAYFFGPRGETHQFDLYTGAREVTYFRLHRHWEEKIPDEPHVVWAKKHRQTQHQRSYPVLASSTATGWFGRGGVCADGFHADIPFCLYSSALPEEEKIKLLRAYHAELDTAIDAKSPLQRLARKWAKTIHELSREKQ